MHRKTPSQCRTGLGASLATLVVSSVIVASLAGDSQAVTRLAGTTAPTSTRPATSSSRPNIVFIFSDDHAVAAISAYGSRVNQTPNIDRLAVEGAVFRNSFCGNSICAPSRATVLTGKHSHANGKRTNLDRFDAGQQTFPKLLQGAGYQTALIGKWHLLDDPQGFDHWEVLPGQGNYYNPDLRSASGKRRVTGYATDIITDEALGWLDARDRDRPFLLMCQQKAPHRTWAPPERYLTLFDDQDLPEPASLFDDFDGRLSFLAANEMSIADYFYWDYDLKIPADRIAQTGLTNPFDRAMKNPEVRRMNEAQRAAWDAAYGPKNAAFLADIPEGEALVRWKYQRYMKDYLRSVQAVDDGVGRVLDYLDAQGIAENTIVVYGSDQGFYLGEHGWYDKRWMFEESMRMPLLMRWPRHIAPGTEVDSLVQNIDYAPTFLDAAGLTVPEDIQGRSMLPILSGSGETGAWRDSVYYAYYEEGEHNVPRHDGVRTERHKLMYFPTTSEWQLFDLIEDPNEMRSLHADPAHARLLREMRQELIDIRDHFGADPWPLPDLPDATITHETVSFSGFTIHVDERLLKAEKAIGERALRILNGDLADLALVVPTQKVEKLRQVAIYLDLDHVLGNMQYHPSKKWLVANGHATELTRAVHIPDASRYIRLAESNVQPWVILHELAHAYHDQFLGFDHPGIAEAYERSKAAGIYDEVLHIRGHDTEHYALTDRKEFFAEMSEAYLGTNDFFPFVRAELRRVDPKTYKLMEQIWK